MFLFAVLCIYNIFYQITDKIAPSDTVAGGYVFFLLSVTTGDHKSPSMSSTSFSLSAKLSALDR